jgi:UDP-N-acetylmuramate dehydrogenase
MSRGQALSWYSGFESFVRENVTLAPLTTYKVGGPAQFFAEPPDAEALGALLRRAADSGIGVRLLGHGTNLLVADSGVSGLVIRLPKDEAGFGFRVSGFGSAAQRATRDCVVVGAAHSLPALVKWSVANNLTGLECLQGVPGTVGAALRMNAGGKHGEIGSRVRAVCGFARDGTPFEFDAGQCGFVYRNSALSGRVVTACALQLAEGRREDGEMLLRTIIDDKRRTQPLAARSAGCAFKNPRQPGVPPAGKLIDELGLKGTCVGGAKVSTLHANFLTCEGLARAGDVAELIRLIRRRALDARGVRLELEVETWGFGEEELQPNAA